MDYINKEYYSTEEYAKILGINVNTVRRWCNKGTIKAKRIGRNWYIVIEEKKESEK